MIDLSEVLMGTDPKPAFLIDGLLYEGQILIIAGDPGAGKSFLQYHIGMSLAAGREQVLGLPTSPGPHTVLYFDVENSRQDLHQYLRWIWRGLDQPPTDTLQKHLVIDHFGLLRGPKERIKHLVSTAEQVHPALIVIDTVTTCMGIEDENDNSEAAEAMRILRATKEAAGPTCAMVLLKHAKFSHDPAEKQTIRGAKAWLGDVDGVIYHRVVRGHPRQDKLRNTKLSPDKVRAFGLRSDIVITPAWVGADDAQGIKL